MILSTELNNSLEIREEASHKVAYSLSPLFIDNYSHSYEIILPCGINHQIKL